MDVQQLIQQLPDKVVQHLPDNVSPTSVAAASIAVFLAAHIGPYVWDRYHLRAIPGPTLAKLSDAWLARVAASGHRSEEVHKLHEKYGPVVRIAPNHVSIADPDALQIIYAHGGQTLKSNFYDAFVSIRRGIFNTRDKADHARKRKIVAMSVSLSTNGTVSVSSPPKMAQVMRAREDGTARMGDCGSMSCRG